MEDQRRDVEQNGGINRKWHHSRYKESLGRAQCGKSAARSHPMWFSPVLHCIKEEVAKILSDTPSIPQWDHPCATLKYLLLPFRNLADFVNRKRTLLFLLLFPSHLSLLVTISCEETTGKTHSVVRSFGRSHFRRKGTRTTIEPSSKPSAFSHLGHILRRRHSFSLSPLCRL